MYSREINGGEHTFGVSGKLIRNVLVMYDHQTRTLWSQFLHEGVEGELTGVKLEVLPAVQTKWAAWRELHPDTKALDKDGGYLGDPYAGYYGDDRAGVIGESNRDDRLRTKDLVVGVNIDGSPKAYAVDALSDVDLLNDQLGGRDVLLFFEGETRTALLYDRNVGGEPLTFTIEGAPAGIQTTLIDDQTGSRWSAFTGRALDGELQGVVLQRIPSHLSFWFAWTDWNPQTALYGG